MSTEQFDSEVEQDAAPEAPPAEAAVEDPKPVALLDAEHVPAGDCGASIAEPSFGDGVAAFRDAISLKLSQVNPSDTPDGSRLCSHFNGLISELDRFAKFLAVEGIK